jgi:hypothetical protein
MPQTLDFVREMATRWEVPVVWLEYHRVAASAIPSGIFPTKRRNQNLARAAERGESAHWFREVSYETASRNGEPFDELLAWMTVLPNVVSRGCSMQLKIRTAMRYLFSLGLQEYESNIGIRLDEAHRATQILVNCDHYEHPKFPLIDAGITETEVLDFWKQQEFDLQLQSYQGNCDLCFLKAKWKRVLMAKQNPISLDWWEQWETRRASEPAGPGNRAVFRMNEPYSEIRRLSQNTPEKIQRQIDAVNDADIPCSCAEKAFGSDGDNI